MSDQDRDIPVKAEWLARTTIGLTRVRALHSPYAIYADCDHAHEAGEPGVVEVEDIGLTCNHVYDVCKECCMNVPVAWMGQSEECASTHRHRKDWRCATLRALDGEQVTPSQPDEGGTHGAT
jgi:hypothetical protein